MLHPKFIYSKRIIYIHEIDVDDTEEFKDYFQQSYIGILAVPFTTYYCYRMLLSK